MLIEIAKVKVGDCINYEWSPGREASPKILRKVNHKDGTVTLELSRFGAVHGYRNDDMVVVVDR